MTLQSSGPISLANVQTEFGGSNPIGINEYYGVAAGVPASGTISLYDFYGKSAAFAFTAYFFGNQSADNQYTGNNNLDSGYKSVSSGSVTYRIQFVGQSDLYYYVGGSIVNTWTNAYGTSNTVYYSSSWGNTTLRFLTVNTDYDTSGAYYSSTAIYNNSNNQILMFNYFNARFND